MASASANIMLEETWQKAVDLEVTAKSGQLSNATDARRELQRDLAAYELLKERLRVLQNAAKELYGFRSPFNTLHGAGEDIADYFSITATREANRAAHTIEIKDVAQSERFKSASVDTAFKFPAGAITVRAGGEEKTIDFAGGNLGALSTALNRAFPNDLKTTLLQESRTKQTLIFDVTKTGTANRFAILKDDAGVFNALMLLEEAHPVYQNEKFTATLLKEFDVTEGYEGDTYKTQGGALLLTGNNKMAMALSNVAPVTPGLTITLSLRARDLSPKKKTVASSSSSSASSSRSYTVNPHALRLSGTESVTFRGITIQGESIAPYGAWVDSAGKGETAEDPRQTPPPVDEPAQTDAPFNAMLIGVVFENEDGASEEKYFNIHSVAKDWTLMALPIGRYMNEGETVTAVIFVNENETYEIGYKDLFVTDREKTITKPKYPLREAKNARIVVDGVAVENGDNEFKKTLPGITITAKKRTPGERMFELIPDSQAITDKIVAFLNAYNDALRFVNNATARPITKDEALELPDMSLSDMLDLADRLSMEYRGDIGESELRREITMRGAFSGETTVSLMKQKLREIMIVAYPTRYGEELALLSQIGISAGRPGSAFADVSGGYMNIEEDVFINAMETRIEGVEELFASDANDDNALDTGVAFNMDNTLNAYVRMNGMIDISIATKRRGIEQQDRTITREKEKLDKLRKDLTAKYATISEQQKEAERTMRQYDNMNNSGNRR